ncbi:preprotein translocase subunit YajC [Corynebacterium sp. TAE3-ERU12]|uniref:preprotein translocase subunit YajC n=1 Tax=Corynebacterium sp. TAE3-ERU12 TaxID=2849491 RepID=UPI001C44F73D|nr:preprotein translocase subunit YajC [Corynebacterium sp. TAE3-ERU12]MBV7295357.1 preprotein translocase subunit YajC [Corynebacterium sp. TAE3-ERU12]
MDPILLIILMVLLLALPAWQTYKQNKRIREIRDMQSRVAPGHRVQTGAGCHGTVVACDETTVELQIAEGVVTTWERAAIMRNLTLEDVERQKAAEAEQAAQPEQTQQPEQADTHPDEK